MGASCSAMNVRAYLPGGSKRRSQLAPAQSMQYLKADTAPGGNDTFEQSPASCRSADTTIMDQKDMQPPPCDLHDVDKCSNLSLKSEVDSEQAVSAQVDPVPVPCAETAPSAGASRSLVYKGPEGQSVFVAGDFSDWQPSLSLHYEPVTQMYVGRLPLSLNGTLQFKFVVDGVWLASDHYQTCADGFNGLNNYVHFD